MVCTSAADTIVLKTKCLQLAFVHKDQREGIHCVVIQVIIVEEKFFQRCVLCHSSCDCLQTDVANQI